MDQILKRKALIVFDNHYDKHCYNEEWDIYFYPQNITEWELGEELLHLVEFYDVLDYPISWPPHLRKEKVLEWIQ